MTPKFRAAVDALADRVAVEPGVIAVTASRRGAGVSFSVVQLGLALAAQGDGEVAVVDANFGAPSLHESFGIDSLVEPSLLSALAEETDARPAKIDAGLHLLVAGQEESSRRGVSVRRFRQVLAELRITYPFVLIDLPALSEWSAAADWAAAADRVLLIAEAGRVQGRELTASADKLRSAGAQCSGVVLNKR